jgi:hypothetical protein
MPGLVTATGVLGFLADEEPELKVFALQTLNDDIDTVWTEVAGALSQMYALFSFSPGPGQANPYAVRLYTKMTASPNANSRRSCLPRSITTFRTITRV